MVLLTGASSTTTTTYRPAPTTTQPRTTAATKHEEDDEAAGELRRGPWTVDEDLTLVNYIAEHGDGRWNALARAAGLKRTGKSCRLRWLNYLRPDVKRGDFTAEEQLLILDLHSRWGNRWSKIAQQLPGRTDNEIKNYWRTRVQKHARQLNCDVNSRRFRDAMTYLWMPRLAERAAAAAAEPKHQQHSSVVVGVVAGNNSNTRSAAAPPCLSALTNTTTTLAAAANNNNTTTTSCRLAENTNSYYHSPGGSSSSGVVPSSSSSDSSLTSVESTAAAHEEKSVYHHHHHLPDDGGAVVDFWTTTMLQGAADHESFWSAAVAPALQEELNDMADLTGWVQGFSDGIVSDADHSLWSLDDIWRMQ